MVWPDPGLEPTIYRTRGMYANYYSIKAVMFKTIHSIDAVYYILFRINHVHCYNKNEICCNMKTKYQYNHLNNLLYLKRNQQNSVYSWTMFQKINSNKWIFVLTLIYNIGIKDCSYWNIQSKARNIKVKAPIICWYVSCLIQIEIGIYLFFFILFRCDIVFPLWFSMIYGLLPDAIEFEDW